MGCSTRSRFLACSPDKINLYFFQLCLCLSLSLYCFRIEKIATGRSIIFSFVLSDTQTHLQSNGDDIAGLQKKYSRYRHFTCHYLLLLFCLRFFFIVMVLLRCDKSSKLKCRLQLRITLGERCHLLIAHVHCSIRS